MIWETDIWSPFRPEVTPDSWITSKLLKHAIHRSVVQFNCTQSTAENIKHDSVQHFTHYQQALPTCIWLLTQSYRVWPKQRKNANIWSCPARRLLHCCCSLVCNCTVVRRTLASVSFSRVRVAVQPCVTQCGVHLKYFQTPGWLCIVNKFRVDRSALLWWCVCRIYCRALPHVSGTFKTWLWLCTLKELPPLPAQV